MSCEVRYQMLRPDKIVQKRKECPVVYIPIGTLEWHGEHNAVGADGLQREGIAIRCAQTGAGLSSHRFTMAKPEGALKRPLWRTGT